ncbi:HAD-IA family hydrolase [Litorimonas sp.]|uniref:HAD-IA family hydrolase n=1 Tax=Litorimonas sp. TaxID=1892381 RepID=UPI003A8C1F05
MTVMISKNSASGTVALPYNNFILCLDLDGTLVDTAPDLIRVTNETIALEGLPQTHFKTARREVGYGSKKLIASAMKRGNHTVSEDRLTELQQWFLSRYAETLTEHSRPFPGVVETLRHLKRGGATLSICTNKPGYLARPLLEKLNLTKYFKIIVGGDEAPKAKPDARHLLQAAGPNRKGKRIVMIGDSFPDIRAGHNAKVPTILMRYGYTPINANRLKPTYALNNFRDIPTILSKL